MTTAGNPATPPILVRKYGGSSIASVERIGAVADDLVARKADGYRLVVVVSAMGRHTDELDHLAHSVSDKPARREMDMLLSVGERISMTLLSMALQDRGCPAISFTGSQCGLITDCSHTEAHIIEVKGDRVRKALADDHVVVVAGFQGVSREKEVTTLGRGGSDATAVALAAALGAERCEILKDVDGVFTGDPHRLDDVRRHDTLTYDEMAALADAGCDVVHPRAVAYARAHDVPLFIGSSFRDAPGTHVNSGSADPVGTPDPCTVRYQPLSLVVKDDVGLLDLTCPAAEFPALRDAAVAETGADLFLGEWLRDGCVDVSWRVLMPSSIAGTLHETLATQANGATLRFRRGLTSLTLVGRSSTNWLAIHAQLQTLLADHDVTGYDLTSDGPVMRLLVSPDQAAVLQQPLHDAFLAGN